MSGTYNDAARIIYYRRSWVTWSTALFSETDAKSWGFPFATWLTWWVMPAISRITGSSEGNLTGASCRYSYWLMLLVVRGTNCLAKIQTSAHRVVYPIQQKNWIGTHREIPLLLVSRCIGIPVVRKWCYVIGIHTLTLRLDIDDALEIRSEHRVWSYNIYLRLGLIISCIPMWVLSTRLILIGRCATTSL